MGDWRLSGGLEADSYGGWRLSGGLKAEWGLEAVWGNGGCLVWGIEGCMG